jgi:hypothetical protein
MALRYADTVSTGAVVVTPHAYASWRSSFAEASATISQFTAGGLSAQGNLSGSHFIRTNRKFIAELGGLAGGSTHNDGTRTGELLADGRAHFPRGPGEFFVGAGIGRTWDGVAWRSLWLGDAGVSVASDLGSVVLSFSPAAVDDTINYADLQATFDWERGNLEIGGVVGTRFGDQLTTLSRNGTGWASINGLRKINERLAVSLSGGTYPIDPTQGFPGGRFISLGLRVETSRRRRTVPVSPDSVAAPELSSIPSLTAFTVSRERGDRVVITVAAPGADLVEITGDFTNWVPTSLTRDVAKPGQWTTRLPLASGEYQMNVRINGGKWQVPPGVLSMLDEFGGAVGLLVVR